MLVFFSSFSAHASVKIKIQSKKRLGFVVMFALLKTGWSCDLPLKRAGA